MLLCPVVPLCSHRTITRIGGIVKDFVQFHPLCRGWEWMLNGVADEKAAWNDAYMFHLLKANFMR
jgi:hypothetical protein